MSHPASGQRFRRGRSSLAFGLAFFGLLVITACGPGAQPDVMADAAADPTNNSAPLEAEPVSTTATETTSADPVGTPGSDGQQGSAFSTTVFTPVNVDGLPESTTTASDYGPRSETDAEPFWDVEVLGISMAGRGEYVRLTKPLSTDGSDTGAGHGDEDTECGLGWLGYLLDGQIHRYTELGPVGHTRLFNGFRGQDAIVVSCEESTERVLIQGSAVLPDDGIPRFTNFGLGEPHVMSYDPDFGWRGDLFGGYAWRDGFDELVYFDTDSGNIVDAATLAGTRIEQMDHGFDIVMPNGWEVLTYEAGAVTLAIAPPDAGSYISVLSAPFVGDPEFPEDTELLDFWTDDVHLWEYVSADRGTIIGSQTRDNWRLSHEGGTLVVQHLEAGDRDLIIHYFVAPGEDHLWDLAQAATDQIRHYQYATVG